MLGALPSFPYAYKKMLCEQALWDAHRRGDFALTVCRPTFTYNEAWSPGIHSFGGQSYHLDRLRRGKPIIMHGDGTSIWVATYRDDTASGFIGAVGNPKAFGQSLQPFGRGVDDPQPYLANHRTRDGRARARFCLHPNGSAGPAWRPSRRSGAWRTSGTTTSSTTPRPNATWASTTRCASSKACENAWTTCPGITSSRTRTITRFTIGSSRPGGDTPPAWSRNSRSTPCDMSIPANHSARTLLLHGLFHLFLLRDGAVLRGSVQSGVQGLFSPQLSAAAIHDLCKNIPFALAVVIGFLIPRVGYKNCLSIAMALFATGTLLLVPGLPERKLRRGADRLFCHRDGF